MTRLHSETTPIGEAKPKATPRILVRIDRGEDWVEMCGDWQDDLPPTCGQGNTEDWLDEGKVYLAWLKLNEAVME